MDDDLKPIIKVASPSFSRNDLLVNELKCLPVRVKVNNSGSHLHGESLANYIGEADGAIIGLENIDIELLERCPDLKMISKYGVGLDNINLNACKKRAIYIGWEPGLNKRAVAEVVLGQMLGLSRNLFTQSFLLSKGIWNKNGGNLLSAKTVGVIGLGNIGEEVIKLLKPFGCKILGNDIKNKRKIAEKYKINLVSKEEIFYKSDIVTLHVPYTPETDQFINKRTFDLMHDKAFLINTSRGQIIDEAALKNALKNKIIAGAALDVFKNEPMKDREFLKLDNLVATPHLAGSSYESILAMGRSAINHVGKWLNIVNSHESKVKPILTTLTA